MITPAKGPAPSTAAAVASPPSGAKRGQQLVAAPRKRARGGDAYDSWLVDMEGPPASLAPALLGAWQGGGRR